MKNFSFISILFIFVLSSCWQQNWNPQVNNSPKTVWGNQITIKENNSLDNNISAQVTDSSGMVKKEFNLSYNLADWRPLEFSWNLQIENWTIKSVEFPNYDLVNWQWYEVEFAKKIQKDLIWKQIKGLQYDWMTWASLTTKAFNEFLNTINK